MAFPQSASDSEVCSFEFWSFGPFFEEENKAVSVVSALYVQMLQNFLKPKLQDPGENETVWFQQSEATAHIAKNQLVFCEDSFQPI